MSRFKQVQLWLGLAVFFGTMRVNEIAWSQVTHTPQPSASSASNDPLSDLQRDLSDIFNDPNFSNATWGVAVQSMETGEWIYRLNESKSLLPASNFKVFTAAEALSLLGPQFRYSTSLVTNGRITDGVLHGDLVIRGAGDPTFGSQEMYPDSGSTWIFDKWADTLLALGIRKIDGAIVGDDSYFTEDIYPLGWAIEDLPYYYAMQTGGLAFDENQVSVTVSPGLSKGSSARYELNPNTDYFTVDNRAVTKADSIVRHIRHGKDSVLESGYTSIDISRDQGNNLITIKGAIPASAAATHQQLSVETPATYAATVFKESLEEHGIEIVGKPKNARDLTHKINYLKSRTLASYVSPPLSQIASVMNKVSDNVFAEQLFRTAAKEIGGEGSWVRGTEVMKRYLASISIDTSRIAIYDGSGLSRMDLISPAQMLQVLKAMHDKPKLFEVFYPGLSIMGVDGSLVNRMKGTAAAGNVHAKTGFVTEVRSVSGYLNTRDGELLAFSMIANNHTAPVRVANNLQDLVMLRLVNFSRK